MIVIIAGGGHTGTQLASLLLAQRHEIRLIEYRREVLARIHRELPTEVIFEGNPTDPRVLEQVGIRQAQVLAACTTEDSDNLAICFVALFARGWSGAGTALIGVFPSRCARNPVGRSF